MKKKQIIVIGIILVVIVLLCIFYLPTMTYKPYDTYQKYNMKIKYVLDKKDTININTKYDGENIVITDSQLIGSRSYINIKEKTIYYDDFSEKIKKYKTDYSYNKVYDIINNKCMVKDKDKEQTSYKCTIKDKYLNDVLKNLYIKKDAPKKTDVTIFTADNKISTIIFSVDNVLVQINYSKLDSGYQINIPQFELNKLKESNTNIFEIK